jgi:GntR family transcriptional regulator
MAGRNPAQASIAATPSEAVPLYRQIAAEILAKLTAGELAPGDRVPSEPELAETYGVARMTARKAIESLVLDGKLTRHKGRGTFVAQPKMPYPAPTVFSFTRAMQGLGLEVTTKLLDLHTTEADADLAADLRIREGDEVLHVRRLRLVSGEPVAIHSSYMAKEYLTGLLAADLLTRPIAEAMARVGNERVAASHDYLEAIAAEPEVAHLLDIEPGEPIQFICGVGYSSTGKPVLATRAWYRADRFRFRLSATDSDAWMEMKTLEGTPTDT